jgi:F0F1-type ATP synthase assembly protein I
MFSAYDFLTMLSELVRMFGLLVFGVAAGWFTIYAFRERPWQLQIAIVLGFFLLVALISFSTPAGGVGSFALGAGAALLFFGLRDAEKDKDESED